jgi:hypothetical protein
MICLCEKLSLYFPSCDANSYFSPFHFSSGALLIRIMKLKSSGAGIFKENEMIFSSEGIFGVKSVQPKQPATVQERCKWIIGDVTEVFDRNTWKLGKILKMSKNNYFVIRLADCIQLKEFHISSLRILNASGAHHSKELPTSDKVTTTNSRTQSCFALILAPSFLLHDY